MIPRTCAYVLLFVMACSGSASAQQALEPPASEAQPASGQQTPGQQAPEEPFFHLAGDVPQWLENYGFVDDLKYDGLAPALAEESGFGEGHVGDERVASSASSAPKCDCLACRSKLTGDWCGCRSKLQQEGIIYKGRTTQFFFGVGGGVTRPVAPALSALGIGGGDTFEYTGNSRHDFLIDLNKVAGVPNLVTGVPSRFVVTVENLWGRWGNVSFETGALSPAVVNSVFPLDPNASGIPYVTNFLIAQPLTENFIMSVGKTRMPGVADQNILAGGDGSDQFLNQTFAMNPLLLPQVPFSSFVVSSVLTQNWGNAALLVIDPQEKATEFMQLDQLFATGVGLLGQVQVDTNFFDMPGEHHAGFWYKNVKQIDLTFTPLPPSYPYSQASPGLASKSDTYSLFYGFDQYVSMYGPPDARGKSEGWGVFGRAGIADGATGNPSFGAWHLSIGIGGDSPFQSRRGKRDRFGLGYAYTATSTQYGPIPQALLGPRDAQSIELYYRYHLTPSIEVTPDVQWIQGMLGGLTNGNAAVVAGIRLNVIL